MCAQFGITTSASSLSADFGIQVPEDFIDAEYKIIARGFVKTDLAPIIIGENGAIALKMAHFSLCPVWAKEFPVKWTTYNARMERVNAANSQTEYIYEVPTFRDSFRNGDTCLVPMNYAVESTYFGRSAGNMVRFSDEKNSVLYTCGLRSQYLDKTTGELRETFTLLTDDPYPFFFEHGHDRSIFCIDEKRYEEWLLNRDMKPKVRFDFLRGHRTTRNWSVAIERPLKPGWERRAPTEAEIRQIKVWTNNA